ncbi:MAG TPA: flagellar hook capping FlgD N-terminal domain-containing protein [Rubrivivax sp.]
MTTTSGVNPYAALNSSGSGAVTQNDADSADRFLKLLVAQMQNQDPLNPMDNAQVTSQMAQINTVNGIDKLNKTVQGLNAQFVQMQALQGAALVGREVTVAGDRLAINDAVGEGAFELAGAADNVKIEILGPAGQPIDTVNLGARSSGRHDFEWPAGKRTDAENLRFRVTATSGAAAVQSTLLTRDEVLAVSAGGDTLTLELMRAGAVPYSAVKTVH